MKYKKIISCICAFCILGCTVPFTADLSANLSVSAESSAEADIVFTQKGQSTQIKISGYTETPTWYSDNTNVATIDESCTVTAVGEGMANIYIVTSSQVEKITVLVKFEETPPEETEIDLGSVELSNEYPSVTATLSNVDASNALWSSSDTSVATVDQKGIITAVGTGSCVITASVNGKNYNLSVTSTYVKQTMEYSLGDVELSNDNPGVQLMLTAISEDADVVWSSTDESVAKVDQNGVITAAGSGECQIIAVIRGEQYASGEIKYIANVKSTYNPSNPPVEKVLGEIELSDSVPSKDITLSGVPEGAAIIWSSSDTSIAEVDQNGTVTAKGSGTCKIFALINGVNYVMNVVSTYSNIGFSSQTTEITGIGNTAQLKLENSDQTPVWTSTNVNVATVDNAGLVTAVGEGEAVILAQIDGKVLSITVIVKAGIVYGDADLDGEIGISDVVKVMCYASNKIKYPLSDEAVNNADVYQRGDGVSALDALSIQKRITQVITVLPES